MAFRTILLQMGDDPRRTARLKVAVDLARRFNAFLDVACLALPAPDGEEPSPAVPTVAEIEAEVHLACRECSYSWSVIDNDHIRELTARTGYADLVIISQCHPIDANRDTLFNLPERLPLEAPCPVLILPAVGEMEMPGRHLLLAWKNCREAGRALRDALPFMHIAERITVLTVGFISRDESDPTDISVYLARHGIEVEFHPDPSPDNDAGEVLLSVARELECDLLAMGAYGHSRLRDMVLGSATHSVLNQMHLPVLMSH